MCSRCTVRQRGHAPAPGRRDRRRARARSAARAGRSRRSAPSSAPGARMVRALQHVRQLAHVARPVVGREPRQRLGREPRAPLRPGAPRQLLQRSVAASGGTSSRRSRSGGQLQREHVEPVEEVLAERAARRRPAAGPRAWRRRCARPPAPGGRCPRGSNSPLLQHAQELRLQLRAAARRPRRGTACRRSRHLEAPGAVAACAPVKAPFTWPNSSLSSRPLGKRRAVERDEGLLRPRGSSAWMARASRSLPVPVSPRMSTGVSRRRHLPRAAEPGPASPGCAGATPGCLRVTRRAAPPSSLACSWSWRCSRSKVDASAPRPGARWPAAARTPPPG